MRLFKKPKLLLIAALLSVIFNTFVPIHKVEATFTPGATLEPGCLPTDSSCTVDPAFSKNGNAFGSAPTLGTTDNNQLKVRSAINAGNAATPAISIGSTNTLGAADSVLEVINNLTSLITVKGNGDVVFTGNISAASCSGCGASGTSLSVLGNATTAHTLTNSNNNQIWNWQLTGATNGFDIGETAASTGTGYIATVGTLAGSTAKPFKISANGATVLDTDSSGNIAISSSLTQSGTAAFNGNTTLGNASSDTLSISSTIQGSSPFNFEGSTVDGNDTTFTITDPTANRTITFKDASGTVAFTSDIGINSLNGLSTANQTFANDTNITISSLGTTHTLGFTGTLAAARLNSNVVQGVTNDTNITGSISGQNLTLGFSGQLSPARGGTGQSTYATGDILYASAANTLSKLSAGTNGQVLTLAGGVPTWANSTSGFTDPMTTAGDIIIRNGSNTTTRLGIGSAGQVLTVSGGVPAWSTVNTLPNGSVANDTLRWNGSAWVSNSSLSNDGSNTTLTGNLVQSGTGTLSTGTGAVTLNGNTTISGSNTFTTGTGAVGLNGDVTVASGKNFTQSGASTFTTGTGASTFNGSVTQSGSGTFTTGTGLFTAGGAGTITGLLTGSLGATISGGTVALNANSNNASNINTGTSTGAVSIGGGSGTVAVNSTTWDITTAGIASGLTGFTTTGNVDVSGATFQGGSPLIFDGATANANKTTFTITDPTANRTITFKDASGTVAFTSDIGINSLNGLSTANQTFANDTNITISSLGTTHTLGFTGTLAAARLNSNVVQGVTNDTNITGSISGQNLTLGFSGQLSPARGGTGINSSASTGVPTISAGTWAVSAKLAESLGGTNQSTYTTGDMLYASASNTLSKLGIGSSNQVLSVSGGVPAWTSINIIPNGSSANDTLRWNGTAWVATSSLANDGTNTSVSGNFTQSGSGIFTTGTGSVSLNGDTTIASGKNFTQAGSGTFTTGSGANTLSGNTTISGSNTFTSGTGAVTLNGNTSVAGTSTFAVGTGSTTLGGTLGVTGNTTLAGDLAVNGGDITSTATSFNFDFGNTGSLLFRDGTNTLVSVVDKGTYGVIKLSDKGSTGDPATCTVGEIYFNDTDNTFKGCVTANTWSAFGGGSTYTASNGLSLSSNDFQLGGSLTGATSVATAGFAFNLTGSGAFSTSTGANTFNGNTTISGSNTFTSGTGAVTLQGNTAITGTSTFTVGTGATTLGGALSVDGNTTLGNATTDTSTVNGTLTVSAGANRPLSLTTTNGATQALLRMTNSAGDFDTFTGSGTPTGVVTGNIGDLYVDFTNGSMYIKRTTSGDTANWIAFGASGADSTTASNGLTLTGSDVTLGGTLSGTTTIATAGFALNLTGSGAFSTPTGANSLNGDVTVASGKNFTQSGASTFTTGTGASTFNGSVTQSGSGTFTTGTGLFTAGGAGTITGLLTGSLGATISGGTVALNANSNNASNINTGTSTGAVSIGGGSGTVAVNSTTWDITTAGIASGLTGFTTTGNVDVSGATFQGGSPLIFDGATANANKTTFTITDPTANRTITFKDASGTVAFTSDIGVFSLNGLSTANQTFVDDTNITISSTGTTHTLGFSGQLSPARGGTGINSSASTGVPTISAGTWAVSAKLAESLGGTNQSTYTTGDMLYASASNTLSKLGIGSSNQVLSVSGGVPAWTSINIIPNGSSANDTLRWNGTAWVATSSLANDGTNTSATGNLTVNGNTTFGDSNSDTMTINSTAVTIPNSLNFNSDTLYIDANNFRVGLGTTAPTSALQVNGIISAGEELVSDGTFKFYNSTSNDTTTLVTGVPDSGSFSLTLPVNTGTNGQVLTTDGAGVMSWTTVSGGASALSALTAATGINNINNGNFAQTWNWSLTGATNAFNIAENTASTGTGYLLSVGTLATSTAKPFKISALGSTVLDTDATGNFTIASNISQSGASTFSTGTGNVTINGATTISGSNTFTTGTGLTTISGSATQLGAGAFTTGTGLFTAGGAATVAGSATFNGSITQSGSGTFSTGTGNVSLNGSTAISGSNTFTTGTGAIGLNGDTTIASGKNFTQSGAGSFTTGSGANTLSGNTTISGSSTFTSGTGSVTLQGATAVTGTNTFTVGTGASTLGGILNVTGATTLSSTLLNNGAATFNAGITVGNGATSAGMIVINEDTDDGSNKVTITSQAMASDYTLTLPVDAGTNGQVLTTNGSGNLTWTTVSGGSSAWSSLTAPTGALALSMGNNSTTFTLSGTGDFIWKNSASTAFTPVLQINDSGSVGIGVNLPSSKLSVKDSVSADDTSASGSDSYLTYTGNTTDGNTSELTGYLSTVEVLSNSSGGTNLIYGINSYPSVNITNSGNPNSVNVSSFYSAPNIPTTAGAGDTVSVKGVDILMGNALGTTGTTESISYKATITGSADNNYGLYSDVTGGTNNYGLYIANGSARLPITGSTQCLQVNTSGVISGSGSTCGGSLSIGTTVTSGTNGSILFVDSGNLAQNNSNFFWDNTNSRLGLGVNSSLKTKLNVVGSTTASGADAIAGIYGDYTLTNSTASGFQFGNRFLNTVNGSTAGTEIGSFIRMTDSTSLANEVRGLEVQAYSGTNTAGVNTGIATYGKTFGIQAVTTAEAGGVSQAAAVFADLDNSTSPTTGNAIRAYTNNATSANLVSLYQETSAFTGTGLLMNFGNSGGSFNGNFTDLQYQGASKLSVNYNSTSDIITQTYGRTASIISYASATDGNTFIWKIPQKATTGTCASAASEGIKIQNNGGTQVGHICISGPSAGSANKLNYYAESFNATSTDLAEYYSDPNNELSEGDVVMLASTSGSKSITKSKLAYDNRLMGIISTSPGLLLTGISESGETDLVHPKPVALNGRVPVKISNENGAIHTGDLLTASATKPGYAMKATRAGMSIGQALEDYPKAGQSTTSADKILVFVNLTYYVPAVSEYLQFASDTLGDTSLVDALTQRDLLDAPAFTKLVVTETAYFHKDIYVNGVITAKEIKSDKTYTKEICLEDVCLNKNQLNQLMQLLNAQNNSGGNQGSANPPADQDQVTPPPAEDPEPSNTDQGNTDDENQPTEQTSPPAEVPTAPQDPQ